MNTTTFEQQIDKEIKDVSGRWYLLNQTRATMTLGLLRARSHEDIEGCTGQIQRCTSEMESLEQTLKFHLSFQDGRRYPICPGFVVNMDANGEIGIEGINKPETFEEAGL